MSTEPDAGQRVVAVLLGEKKSGFSKKPGFCPKKASLAKHIPRQSNAYKKLISRYTHRGTS
ncbi:MAG: hypothetical protein CMJ78_04805 [Planctomycetaceae bacterium]|nr:hypothetical protein [Planctomycetaceae bacterium]